MYEHELNNGVPILLAISTCPRCSRMKKFLESHHIKAKVIDIDLLSREEKKQHLKFLQPSNPSLSFPTLIVGDVAVIGEDYDGVKEVLEL
ncbi:MAG: glutaredoxin domain-containing protein [bacterium]|nr:glutaredoxin domain-containing protein [bacterium]